MKYNQTLPTPCFVCEVEKLKSNLEILQYIQKKSKAKILLALKGFALYHTFEICKKYLSGCNASGLNEAILADEYFGGELHTYSPAFKECEFDKITKISTHIIFNSINQLKYYKDRLKSNNSIGLRINPEVSTVATKLYDPCAINSRLGVTKVNLKLDDELLKLIDGFHFHTLCEQNIEPLQKVLDSFIVNFSLYFKDLKWINFGGGHHITRDDYKIDELIKILLDFKTKFPHIQIYLEPSEAIGWQSGYLQSTILDIVNNGIDIVLLDTSSEAHMPDILAMPYTPQVRGAKFKKDDIFKYHYQLAGNTCLAGDIMGDYYFSKPLKINDIIIFEDMIHYTMVKITTFNGINLPLIALKDKNGKIDIIKQFDYKSYKERL